MATIRAKFKLDEVRITSQQFRQFEFSPVYSNDPNHENKAFWDATPNGKLVLGITNKSAWVFEHGKEYYLDITEAE